MTTHPQHPRYPWRLPVALLLRVVCSSALLLFVACGFARASDAPQEIEVPPWFKISFLDLRDDIKEATAGHKRVMLYFGQNGCPYCKRLMEVNFKQKDIVDKMKKSFDAIELNIFGNREVGWIDGRTRSEKEFSALFKVQFTPTLLFLDEKGGVALRVNGYYSPQRFMAAIDYVAQHNENKLSFAEFEKRYSKGGGGALHDEPFFGKPPYALDRRQQAQRPLAIFFEHENCTDCDELHATALQSEQTRQLLSQFEVYRLNLRGSEPVVTPSGAKTTAQRWAQDLNVSYAPSVVFFDRSGREVFRVEAYMRTFHFQSALDYVASGAYQNEPSFQRYIQARTDAIVERGGRVDLMK